MKCLPQCGWQEMPNNLVHMKRHLEACIANGAWSNVATAPVVVWREGQFFAVIESEENERQFEVGVVPHRAAEAAPVVPSPGMPPLDVEPVEQLIGHTLVDTPAPNETVIVAEFEDPTEEKPVAKKPRRKKVN